MTEIKPIAMPGTHQRFLKYFSKFSHNRNFKILDIGAGHGAFSKELFEQGYDVSACDLFPENFFFDKIECKKADITKDLPYQDVYFDLVIAIEVSEHILDHEVFFREASRVLKPNGHFYLSTPNILSFKSRLKFLSRGFYYGFGILDANNQDGLQHVSSITLDQYNYIAVKNGFKKAKFDIDKVQKSSFWLYIFLYPVAWINCKLKDKSDFHNQKKLLLGRLLFLNFENNKGSKKSEK